MISPEKFKNILPDKCIITTSESISKYSLDKTKNISAKADLVLIPGNTKQISEIMAICSKKKYSVIPRGGGSGVTGGAAAVYGGIILSMENFNNIIEIDPDNMTAIVEPGVITGNINTEAEKFDLFYPPDPASLEECSIGGNIAESAGGPRAVKYGTTKDYILGMEFVTAKGEIITYGGKYVKNATGYNLSSIITGSEGTLAIITKIWLRLLPKPVHTEDILVSFETLDEAIDTVFNIIKLRTDPASIEFMEKEAIELVSQNTGGNIPFSSAGAHLIIQLDGESETAIMSKKEKLFSLPNISETNTFCAKDKEEKKQLWSARRGIRDAIAENSPVFFAEDCVVPRSEIPTFIKETKDYLNKIKISSIFFGHAGDGNVHLDILKENTPDDEWERMTPLIKKEIYSLAKKHGGTISGEHGIGSLRKEYLKEFISEAELDLIKRIKQAFDPDNILNPGKIFD